MEEENEVQTFRVVMASGTYYELGMKLGCTIMDVKKTLANKFGIPADLQRITVGDELLSDETLPASGQDLHLVRLPREMLHATLTGASWIGEHPCREEQAWHLSGEVQIDLSSRHATLTMTLSECGHARFSGRHVLTSSGSWRSDSFTSDDEWGSSYQLQGDDAELGLPQYVFHGTQGATTFYWALDVEWHGLTFRLVDEGSLTAHEILIEMFPTIRQVKERLVDIVGIDADHQQLFIGSRMLQDSEIAIAWDISGQEAMLRQGKPNHATKS